MSKGNRIQITKEDLDLLKHIFSSETEFAKMLQKDLQYQIMITAEAVRKLFKEFGQDLSVEKEGQH